MKTEDISLFGRKNIMAYSNRFNNLNELFRYSVDNFANKVAIMTEEISLTYEELEHLSNQVASYLQKKLGIIKNDRIAMVVGNRHYFPIVLFACSKIGATLIPVNVKLSSEEKEFIFSHSEVKAVISELEYEESVSQAIEMSETISLPQKNFVVIDREPDNQQVFQYSGEFIVEEVNELDDLFILYTSGTTGKPKGAVLTHINVIHSLMNYQHTFKTHKDLKTIIAVPIFHVTGLVAQFLHLIYIGGTSYLMKKYQNKQYIDLTIEHQINFHFNVPTIFIMMSTTEEFQNHSFDFVERVAFGGSPIYKQTFEMLQKAFPNASLHNAYGSTETTSPATLMPADYPATKLNSVGKPVPVADIKVIGEDGQTLKDNEVGELYIKGPMVVKEYWKNPEANEENFDNGYWKSGDIGYRDEDGFFYIRDRKKDMINHAGEKVFSIEVEDVLKSHPDIDEAAVVGIPDEVFGEKVKAFVVSPKIKESDVSELKNYCKKQLAKFKVPEVIELVDELPRNASGKILKSYLKNN